MDTESLPLPSVKMATVVLVVLIAGINGVLAEETAATIVDRWWPPLGPDARVSAMSVESPPSLYELRSPVDCESGFSTEIYYGLKRGMLFADDPQLREDLIEQLCEEQHLYRGLYTTSGAADLGSSLSFESVALAGLTDFVLARAQTEVATFVFQELGRKLCGEYEEKASAENRGLAVPTPSTYSDGSTVTKLSDDKVVVKDAAGHTIVFNDGELTAHRPAREYFPETCLVVAGRDQGDHPVYDIRKLGRSLQAALEQDLKTLLPILANGLERRNEPWAETVIALYQAYEAVGRGDHPLLVVGTLASRAGCGDPTQATCGLRVGGLVLQAVSSEHEALTALDLLDRREVRRLATMITAELDNLLKRPENETARDWADKHLDAAEIINAVSTLLPPSLRLYHSVLALRDTDDSAEAARKVVTDTTLLLEEAVDTFCLDDRCGRLSRIVKAVERAWSAGETGDYGGLVTALTILADEFGLSVPIPEQVRKYVPLITAIADAKTSADVTAALEAYSAPIGSWREKRERAVHVSLTSFVGVTAGVDEESEFAAAFVPLGVDLVFGAPRCRGCGFMFTGIDVGNLATVRFDGAEIGDVKLEQVLAPGVYFRAAPAKAPLVVGLGASYVNNAFTLDDGTTVRGWHWRANAYIAVDVTILPFFQGRDRKYRKVK